MAGLDTTQVRGLLDHVEALIRHCKYVEALPLARQAVRLDPHETEKRGIRWDGPVL